MSELDAVYAERNRLVSALAHLFVDVAWRGVDPEAPGFTIVYIDLPTGQVSWHVPNAEMGQFPALELRDPTGWDGSGVDEKYRRLAELRDIPATIGQIRAAGGWPDYDVEYVVERMRADA